MIHKYMIHQYIQLRSYGVTLLNCFGIFNFHRVPCPLDIAKYFKSKVFHTFDLNKDVVGCNATEEDILTNEPRVFTIWLCQLTTYWNYASSTYAMAMSFQGILFTPNDENTYSWEHLSFSNRLTSLKQNTFRECQERQWLSWKQARPFVDFTHNKWLMETTCQHAPGHFSSLFAVVFFLFSHSGSARSGVSLKTIAYRWTTFDGSETHAEISLISLEMWSLTCNLTENQWSIWNE